MGGETTDRERRWGEQVTDSGGAGNIFFGCCMYVYGALSSSSRREDRMRGQQPASSSSG